MLIQKRIYSILFKHLCTRSSTHKSDPIPYDSLITSVDALFAVHVSFGLFYLRIRVENLEPPLRVSSLSLLASSFNFLVDRRTLRLSSLDSATSSSLSSSVFRCRNDAFVLLFARDPLLSLEVEVWELRSSSEACVSSCWPTVSYVNGLPLASIFFNIRSDISSNSITILSKTSFRVAPTIGYTT
jgi:hypothetical protein